MFVLMHLLKQLIQVLVVVCDLKSSKLESDVAFFSNLAVYDSINMPDSALIKRRPMPQHLCCAFKCVLAFNSDALFMLLLWLPSVRHVPALI